MQNGRKVDLTGMRLYGIMDAVKCIRKGVDCMHIPTRYIMYTVYVHIHTV